MKFKVVVIGLLFSFVSLSVYAKAYLDYWKEARAKSPICQQFDKEFPKGAVYANERTIVNGHDAFTYGISKKFLNMEKNCFDQSQSLLPPEAIPLQKAYQKVKHQELLEIQNKSGLNADGSIRHSVSDTIFNSIFAYYITLIFNAILYILQWATILIVLLLGIMVFTQPTQFIKLMIEIFRWFFRLNKKTDIE